MLMTMVTMVFVLFSGTRYPSQPLGLPAGLPAAAHLQMLQSAARLPTPGGSAGYPGGSADVFILPPGMAGPGVNDINQDIARMSEEGVQETVRCVLFDIWLVGVCSI